MEILHRRQSKAAAQNKSATCLPTDFRLFCLRKHLQERQDLPVNFPFTSPSSHDENRLGERSRWQLWRWRGAGSAYGEVQLLKPDLKKRFVPKKCES